MLSKKAQDNCEVAIWAEQNKKYDVAVSRYYYELYQKIIIISKLKNFYVNPPSGEDSHIYIIENFSKEMETNLSPEEITYFKKMKRLKGFRKDADYGDALINENKITVFKKIYQEVKSVLDSV